MPRPISIVLKGDYTDRDVKRAIRDLGSLQTQGKRTSDSLYSAGKKTAIGLGLGAAAAGYFALKVGSDAVRAAMEDEQASDKLATTLGNLGLAYENVKVEKFIDDMQFQSMFSDNDLRPALDRLLRSTKDVDEAERALGISMDVAQAKGKTVSAVADVMGKAYDGNTNALGRMGLGLDKTLLKTGDIVAITDELARLYNGQAAAGVDNLSGKLKLLQTGADELQESFGGGIIEGFFAEFEDGTGSIDTGVASLRNAQPTVNAFGQVIGGTLADAIGWMSDFNLGAMKMADTYADALALAQRAELNVDDFWGAISDEEAEARRRALDAEDASRDQAMANYVLATSGGGVASSLKAQAAASGVAAGATDSQTGAVAALNAELAKNKGLLDHLSARASVEAAIDAFGGLDSQGTKTWKDKHGKTHTSTFTKQFQTDWNSKRDMFNLGTDKGRQGWDAAKALIDATIAEAGTEGTARAKAATYKYGRKSLVEQLTGIGVERPEARAFARQNLGTPSEITRQVTYNYNFTGDMNVPTTEAAMIEGKRRARLAQIGTRPGPVSPRG